MDYYKRAGEVRYACSHLLGVIDVGIRIPACAPSLEEIRESLEHIREKAGELHDLLVLV